MDVEKMVRKWSTLPEEEKGYTSEDARDLLVIPDLEKLLTEDSQWHFPQEAKDRIAGEMERMRRGEYLP
jgi:predicted DNA-binding ArsR family transcriptional regulator